MQDFITRLCENGMEFDLAVTLSECCDEHSTVPPEHENKYVDAVQSKPERT